MTHWQATRSCHPTNLNFKLTDDGEDADSSELVRACESYLCTASLPNALRPLSRLATCGLCCAGFAVDTDGECVTCLSNAGPWFALFASNHIQPLRLCQLLIALVINALVLWSYHATPDLLPYTEEAINNGSDPILPWDVAWSTEYTFNTRKADVAVRVLGALLAAVGGMLLYLKLTNATVMILPKRCCDHDHATAVFPRIPYSGAVGLTSVPTRCCMTARFVTMCIIA